MMSIAPACRQVVVVVSSRMVSLSAESSSGSSAKASTCCWKRAPSMSDERDRRNDNEPFLSCSQLSEIAPSL